MILAIDIGNTNIVLGGMEGDRILFQARLATDRIKTSDQYAMDLRGCLSIYGVKPQDVEGCILSSVVPPVLNAVRTGLQKAIHQNPLVVGQGLKTGLNIKMDNPGQVGSDRIVIAVGAMLHYKPPLILMDLGTATTMEVVDEGGSYVGGCIIPGVRTSLDALTSRAAQLPSISLGQPGKVIGKNTVECMKSGILYGTAAMMDSMIDRLEEELGAKTTVVATGGIAPVILPLCKQKIHLEKDLMLQGLAELYRRNK